MEKVLELAVNAHKGQGRKSSFLPFIVHPLSVMTKLRKLGINDTNWLSAAVLHDVIEDCNISKKTLLENLKTIYISEDAENILNIVVELTHYPILENKEEYLQSFRNKSVQALIIKILDRIDNVEDYGLDNRVYASKYLNKAKILFEIYRERKNEIQSLVGYDFIQLLSNEITRCWTRFDLTPAKSVL